MQLQHTAWSKKKGKEQQINYPVILNKVLAGLD